MTPCTQFRAVACQHPDECGERRQCVLRANPPPMSDWRADPLPYPLRTDDKPRATYPEGVTA